MMKFRNKRSGIVIEMPEGFSGKNWESIEAPKEPEKRDPETSDKKKRNKAKPKG